jgi:predicted acylesterase/phospholipase RssA
MSNITVKAGTQIASINRLSETAESRKKKGVVDALVLSAGGLFAAYQAGVYKALWPYWKPDLVVGASAGALNGWLIAAHIHPDDLIDQWLHPDAAKAVKFRDRPNLWSGYFDPGPLLARARDIQRDFERRLPLGVVSVEVPRFRPRIFRNEEITPEHLVATCSIPLLYPTVRINGRRLLDGGLFEATPVWAAAAMGATRVIAINSLPKLTPWPIHVVLSAMHRMRKMPLPEALDVSLITPSGWLGGAREAVVWERGNIRRWVDMGIQDGENFIKSWGGV